MPPLPPRTTNVGTPSATAAGTIHPTPPTTTAESRIVASNWQGVISPLVKAMLCGGRPPTGRSFGDMSQTTTTA